MAKLSATKLKSLGPGRHGDGARLWFQVGGGRSWAFRYAFGGKARQMGLGPYPEVSLGEARQKAQAAAKLLAQGIDPIEARKAVAASSVTFREAAERFIASHQAGWRNAKHAEQWGSTLRAHAFPAIGSMSVGAVETAHVLAILQPIWTVRTETASRLRGRIESVLDAAKAQGWRTGENPARWRGHLDQLLPKPSKVRAVVHHPALPWQEVPNFTAALRQREGVAALALRFAVLCAARSGEARGATWAEIDMAAAVWIVPAARMKAGKEHRVPLSDPAIEILREVQPLAAGPGSLVFPGAKNGKPLSDMSLTAVLRRMGRSDLTAHGFRSSFRDWCSETGQPGDLAEAALAHAIGSKVEAAYRRGDLFERRRLLMNAWARHCIV